MEISITNFKSIGKAQMKLGRVTVLLGPPAAGKSNVLEAMALATYFDRFVLYSDVEPLSKLVGVDDIRGLSVRYDAAKAVQVDADGGEWRRLLRIYFQKDLRLELNGIEVPVETSDDYTFLYNGLKYRVRRVDIDGSAVVRLYSFDRFRQDVVSNMVGGSVAEAPHGLLREDAKNFGAVAAEQPEVFRDVNAELKELGQVEVGLLDDGRVAVFDSYAVARPPDSLLRALYYLTGLSSAAHFAKRHGLEGRTAALLEEPETHPRLLHVLVKHIEKLSEVVHVAVTTHSPILVSMLRDRLDVALYYVYRGCTGLTEVAELDEDAMAEELITAEDVLFMKPREVLRFVKR